ncbi:hemin uptake protein HemP [Devosia sp. YIM 151766]|nr:hemin uptake protein HemP [Devosia sp. YIM 151766]WIY52927.1 hemin uptake protein HemP [Devosia sp. YIM 151766]
MTRPENDKKYSESKLEATTPKKSVKSEDIFHDSRSLTIIHAGSEYTLRITKQNKLILTK